MKACKPCLIWWSSVLKRHDCGRRWSCNRFMWHMNADLRLMRSLSLCSGRERQRCVKTPLLEFTYRSHLSGPTDQCGAAQVSWHELLPCFEKLGVLTLELLRLFNRWDTSPISIQVCFLLDLDASLLESVYISLHSISQQLDNLGWWALFLF